LNLLKKNGYLGLIVPKSLAYSQAWKPCRDLIKDDLVRIVDVSRAFEEVLLEQVIIIIRKGSKGDSYEIENIEDKTKFSVPKDYILKTDSIILHDKKSDFELFRRILTSSTQMKSISKTFRGLPLQRYVSETKSKYKIFRGASISRFHLSESSEYLDDSLKVSKIKSLMQPKLLSQRIVAHVTRPTNHIIIMSTIDKDGKIIGLDTVENTILTDKKYQLENILAILNSKLISWYAYRYIFAKAIRTMDFDDYYVGKIPIHNIPKETEARIIGLVDEMLSLTKKFKAFDKTTSETKSLKDRIDKVNEDIDYLIYDIYGLTKDETDIIKSS
jgi:adenine-specific DNA-methyltransferase